MSKPKCPKCGTTEFGTEFIKIADAPKSLMAVICLNCNSVISILEADVIVQKIKAEE